MNKEERKEKLKGALSRLCEIVIHYAEDAQLYNSDAFGDLDYPDDCEVAHNAGFAEGILFAIARLKRAVKDE